ncbi:MAG: rhodanese-like domain-containing protein [Faecousia sp.]
MKKTACMLLACLFLLLGGCGPKTEEPMEEVYMNITPEEAKRIMDTETGYVILDVRTEAEFAERHIPGAILIPDYELAERAEAELPDKDRLILVYCRSGRRSKNAAQILVSLGYTKIREFGGIIDWPYETE